VSVRGKYYSPPEWSHNSASEATVLRNGDGCGSSFGTLLFRARGAYNDNAIVETKRPATPTAIVAVLRSSPVLEMPGRGLAIKSLRKENQ